ncbi:MAG: hypothetical protein JNL25_02590 [Rhodospirillaceae bacterium]|nr:hypothetical protein [Rhodospirillaceae bacterium]
MFKRAAGLASLLSLAVLGSACTTHGLNATYYGANLAWALHNGNEFDRPEFVLVEDWPATLSCMIEAVVAEVPLSDQSILVQSMRHRYYGGELDKLYVKYFWQSPVNGEIVWPGSPGAASGTDGRLRFENGKIVPELDFELRRRMRRNFESGCPALAERYPSILDLPLMEEI